MARKIYQEGVPSYAAAGWDGVIPVKRGDKRPNLEGVTGHTGDQLSPEKSRELSETPRHAYCNLGLRLPRGFVGVDVDDYGTKTGGTTLRNLEELYGPLPKGPYSTARGPGVSGIRIFRTDDDLDFEPEFGPEIEAIRFAHRFVVAWPSTHHTGSTYRWYHADGTPYPEGEVPRRDEFPELPASWADRFGRDFRVRGTSEGTLEDLDVFFETYDSGTNPEFFNRAKQRFEGSQGSRHDSMLKALGEAMRHSVSGLYPARQAVDQLHELWTDATDGEDRESEFQDLAVRAASDAAAEGPIPYFQVKATGSGSVAIADVDDTGPVIIFERPSPEEAAELSGYVPEGYSSEWTPGISGIYDMERFEGRDVTVFLYEDASSDLDTVNNAIGFEEEARIFAESVKFVSSRRDIYKQVSSLSEDRRSLRLRKFLDSATDSPYTGTKPRSNKKRDATAKGDEAVAEASQKRVESELQGRRLVEVCGDRKLDNDAIVDSVKAKWGGRKVFNYGGAISRVKEDQILPQDKAMWMNTLVEACKFVQRGKKGELKNVDPPAYSVTSTLSRAEDFSELLGVRHAPFVREDGTVCQTPGYDLDSKMKLFLTENLSGIQIPDEPTDDEVADARRRLDDWLVDFRSIMPTDADKANILALILTPFIRGSVPIVPLCVIDGLQHGVGKNKLANGISILYTGKELIPKTFTNEDEEQRKALMSVFREGDDFVCYDEAHYIDGKALAQALTASTWSDRLLGVSQMAEYPNNATWMSLGNNVRVEGDCIRRVYKVQLKPTTPNPEDRTSSDFQIKDFEQYTRDNRKDLLVAVLTLIRGWYAAGKPRPTREPSFGSFERWEGMVRGILEYAEVPGFLDNQQEIRGDSSANFGFWVAHYEWLYETFADEAFTTREVQLKLMSDQNAEPPPSLEDSGSTSYARQLGIAYSRMKDRFIENYRLTRLDDRKHRNVLWKIVKVDA